MSHRSTCRDVHDHASDLLAAETEEQLAAIREHLARCPPCQEYLRQIGMTVELLHSLPRQTAEEARAKLVDVYKRWAATKGQ
jgi:predicted anti-sigma-YlaC factor YlaD